MQAWVWHNEHFCPEEARDRLAFLTLPRLDMAEDELLSWARENPSISATWLLKQLGEGDPGPREARETTKPRVTFLSFDHAMARVAEKLRRVSHVRSEAKIGEPSWARTTD